MVRINRLGFSLADLISREALEVLCGGARDGSSCLQLLLGAWLLWDLVVEAGAQ